jgi:hypothetical protein
VDAYSPPPLSVLLKRKVCAMAGDFDNDMRIAREKQERWRLSQERSGTFFGATRELSDRKPQPRRKDGVPEPQRRPI